MTLSRLFTSPRSQLILLVAIAMGATMLVTILFTRQNVVDIVTTTENSSARSILLLVATHVKARYDSLEQAPTQHEKQSIIADLEAVFKKMQPAYSASIFLFDNKNNILIAPARAKSRQTDNTQLRVSVSDALLAELRRSAKQNTNALLKPLRYPDPFTAGSTVVDAFVSYLTIPGWYVVVAVPVDNIPTSVQTRIKQQSLLIGIFFILGLSATAFLLTKIIKPPEVVAVEVAAEVAAEKEKNIARRATASKNKFIAHISHELRTPLNGILGFVQVLRHENNLTEKQIAGLVTIRQCCDHLLGLVEEILDLATMEAGKMELNQRSFSLQHLLQPIIELFKIRAEEKELSFHISLPSPMPAIVFGDDLKLRQVLLNLLGNAVKFTNSGSLSLRVSRIRDRMFFQIEDTGIGIPAEKLDDIFQPFSQIHPETTPSEGTGLGLAISQQLVDLMGGSLAVHSSLGKGSTFWFDIRLPESQALDTQISRSEEPHITADDATSSMPPSLPLPQAVTPVPPVSSRPIEPVEQLEHMAVNNLPDELIDRLWQAASTGHYDGILAQLGELEALGDQHQNLVTRLRELADQFKFDAICAMVDPMKTRSTKSTKH